MVDDRPGRPEQESPGVPDDIPAESRHAVARYRYRRRNADRLHIRFVVAVSVAMAALASAIILVTGGPWLLTLGVLVATLCACAVLRRLLTAVVDE